MSEPAQRSWLRALDEALGFLGERLRGDEPVAPLCTYKVGGAARRFVEVADERELERIVHAVAAAGLGLKTVVIGRGSNLLVSDSGFDGLMLRLGESFTAIRIEGTTVECGAAASLPVVARRTAAAGLTGFEWAVGVPGSMGGAVSMNAGGHGSDMEEVVSRVRVHHPVSGKALWMSPELIDFGYRGTALPPNQVVSRVDLALSRGDRADSEELIAEIVRWRRENQPGGQNAGSVFTNPPGDSAGRLIDQAGCKGLRIGTAEVSTKHANFIQADRGGSADDVAALMAEVAKRVADTTGVRLLPETRMLGFRR
ncbi:MAG: UDP-N-acetylmuramate dehydrogenase [Microthrixaceae bacterium]